MQQNRHLSQTQLGLYVSDVNAVPGTDYNICMLYHLDRDIDLQKLKSSVAAVLNNHPYVCSTLVQNPDGMPGLLPPDVPVSEDAAVGIYADVDALKAEMTRRFDLFGEPLFRFGLAESEDGAILGMCFHHLVFDGMSFSIFRSELEDAYGGKALEPETEDAFTCASREEEERGGDAYIEAGKWYEKEFGGASEVDSLLLPDVYDQPVGEQAVTKAVFPLTVPGDEILRFSHSRSVGVSIPFTAAFGFVLANFTGDTEALFATIHHGRTDESLMHSFGMFVKTFPVYVDYGKTPSIASLLSSVSEQIKGSRARSVYSFGDCCRDLGLNIRICFAFQGKLYDYDIELGGRRQKSEDIRSCRPGYSILFNVFQNKDGVYECMVQYSPSAYSEAFIRGLVSSYDKVLNGFLVKEFLSEVELADDMQTAVLDGFNPEPVKVPDTDTVVSLFRRAASAYPDRPAVKFNDKVITYRELDSLSDRLSLIISEKTAGRCSTGLGIPVVSLLMGRSSDFPVMTLSVLKSGAAYQPLDPSYPKDRLDFMLGDSGASLLISDKNLASLVNFPGETVFSEELLEEASARPVSGICPGEGKLGGDSAFTLLYTSGSTGVPKGVVIGHHNLLTFCDWYRRFYSLSPDDCVAAYASFGFDADMMDLYPALTTGASVCIIPEEIRLDLYQLGSHMEQHGVTHAFMTTQVGYQFVTLFPSHPTLKHLSIGGEKLAPIDPPAGYKLYNPYGPTECTVFSTIYPVVERETNIPIGRPLDTLSGSIVNRYGQRLPVGAAGELVIFGDQVSRGYLNRPDKTAEVFGVFGEKSYRSGDIVRYRQDGNIEFVGRKDGQVKIRGFRIELKEVEAVIRSFDGVRDVTVQAYDLESGGKFIAAFVVPDGDLDISALNRFILSQKPPYMVPAVTMKIDAVPLNVNQKVDRKKLPKPVLQEEKPSETDSGRGPNLLEKKILEELGSLLGAGSVGINTPLSECGLSSILAMRFSAWIYNVFNIRLKSTDILDGASVSDIENMILERLMSRPTEEIATAGRKWELLTRGESGLSFAQQGVYSECLRSPDSILYNIPMEMKFPATVNASALADAVRRVLPGHSILFANFKTDDDGNAVQVVRDDKTVDVPVVRRNDVDAVKAEFVRPFNLENDTLFRALVVDVPDGGPVLLLDIHHLVCDGSSFDIIVREIAGCVDGKPAVSESYSYLNFCRDQKLFSVSGSFKEHAKFFAEQLIGFESVTQIPPDVVSDGLGRQAEVAVKLPAGVAGSGFAGVTPAAFYLAASAYAIGRYSNVKDVYMSVISSGRQDVLVSGTVGMFVNTLPLYARIGDVTVRDYVTSVAGRFRAVTDHENYPFPLIAAEYGYSADIVYAYQLDVISDVECGGSRVAVSSFGLDRPKFGICILVEMNDGAPSIVIQYDDSRYSRDLMQSLAESIVVTATAMATGPDSLVCGICMLSPGRKKILESFHQVAESAFEVDTFHEGIERWARKAPDAVAVVAIDRVLTYAQFDAEACRMARALMAEGLRKGDRTVLLLPRRSDFLVAVYAVMKCGAVFIPMDPEYPADRISYILDNSESRFVLTTADKTAFYPGKALDIATVKAAAVKCLPDPVKTGVSPDDLAYIIYTSGSTGTPKGVTLQHRGIVNYLTPHPANPHTAAVAGKCRGVLCSATVSFDLSILEYGTALFNGKVLVFADESTVTDALALARAYQMMNIEVLSGTPSRIDAYMEVPEYCEVIKKCKVIQMGGEKLPLSLLNRLRNLTSADIYNMYGPTEITICCNAARLNDSAEVHVGKPLPGFSEYIIDSDGNELPVGVTGELVIAGTGVCPGYYGLPEKTAESFIEWNGRRAYKSGDYAFWTKDGNIVISGRKDSQVKLNGLRVELGEIELVMGEQPGVRQCAVGIRRIGNQDKLVAWYTVDGPCSKESICEGMAERLTRYMVPNILMQLDRMPTTPAGKVDTKHLPIPAVEDREYIAPRNDVEKFFCDTVAKVLNIERVSVFDNFFEIGGSSLVAMRLVVALSRGGYNIAYKDIFDNPAPADMAAFVGEGHASLKRDADLDSEVSDYDYGRIEGVISENTISTYLADKSVRQLGNVLLTGATGYLGAHILYELLEDDSIPSIHCLVRSRRSLNAVSRLQSMLFYYFGKSYEEEVGKRLFVIEGDVTCPIEIGDAHIDTVINCAANVKHFSSGTDIEDINIGGVENCIALCLRTGALLIQTSTGSVSGVTVLDGDVTSPHTMQENELYFGQDLSNKYLHSKFLAERIILENIAQKGLKAKIMRLGNLAPRSSDGEFQINFYSNSYMGRLKAYQILGAIPYSGLVAKTEFSPIDDTARAIHLLAGTNSRCTIFNVFNSRRALYMDIIGSMEGMGYEIRPVEAAEFDDILQTALLNPENADILQSVLAYSSRSDGKKAVFNDYSSDYTTEVLLHLGFRWTRTDGAYIERFLRQLQTLEFFDSIYKR